MSDVSDVFDYLDPQLVIFLDASSRDEVIGTLVDVIYKEGRLHDKSTFYNAIIEREKIVSTGVGMGTAIPHAKLSDCEGFFIAIGILSKGVDWQAIDRAPVRIVFMVGGPDGKQTEYLRLLSGLTSAIKDEGIRKKILSTKSKQEIVDLFRN